MKKELHPSDSSLHTSLMIDVQKLIPSMELKMKNNSLKKMLYVFFTEKEKEKVLIVQIKKANDSFKVLIENSPFESYFSKALDCLLSKKEYELKNYFVGTEADKINYKFLILQK